MQKNSTNIFGTGKRYRATSLRKDLENLAKFYKADSIGDMLKLAGSKEPEPEEEDTICPIERMTYCFY